MSELALDDGAPRVLEWATPELNEEGNLTIRFTIDPFAVIQEGSTDLSMQHSIEQYRRSLLSRLFADGIPHANGTGSLGIGATDRLGEGTFYGSSRA